MKLNEIFQDAYPYEWKKHSNRLSVAVFTSTHGKTFEVDFVKGPAMDENGKPLDMSKAIISFFLLTNVGNGISSSLTNDRDHLMILSTVIKIIKNYVSENNISILRFGADKSANRSKVYGMIARRFASLYNFTIETSDGHHGTDFNLIKNSA